VLIIHPSGRNIRVPQPFLHIGDVGPVLEGVSRGSRPERMHAEVWGYVGKAQASGISPYDVVIHGRRVQGLGQGPGAIVLHRPEEWPVQVVGVPAGPQVRSVEQFVFGGD